MAFLISKDTQAGAKGGAWHRNHLRPKDTFRSRAEGAGTRAQGGQAERRHLKGDQKALGDGVELLVGGQGASGPMSGQ